MGLTDSIPGSVRARQARDMLAFLARREAARLDSAECRRALVDAALPELLTVLATHGATRVWVFGSFVTGSFDEHSDLDLATEGLPGDRYFAARAALSERCPVDFDLVAIECASDALRAEIIGHGRLLSGAPS